MASRHSFSGLSMLFALACFNYKSDFRNCQLRNTDIVIFVQLHNYRKRNLCKFVEVVPMDTVDRLFALVDKKYREQKDFAAEIGVAPARVSEWRNRKSQSYAKHIPQIATALGTTTEYLLVGETARPREGDELLRAVEGLSEENRQKAKDYIEMLLALQGRK